MSATAKGNGSGLILRQERDSRLFRIKTVVSGLPAAEAGLQPSDLIEQVNGISAPQWTLEALEDALREPGQSFVLVVSNPSGERDQSAWSHGRSSEFIKSTAILGTAPFVYGGSMAQQQNGPSQIVR